jgi:hypothetical protein
MRIVREETEVPIPPALLEALAEIEHRRWTSQAFVALFDMDEARRRRWFQEVSLPYAALPERLKQLDRDEVMKYWPVIEEYLKSRGGEA